MIKLKKYDVGGFAINIVPYLEDLTAISLQKKELADIKPMRKGSFPELITYSKISSIDENFAVRDIMPLKMGDFYIRAKYEDSIIFCEFGEHDVYRCTASDNEYKVINSEYHARKYGDVFVVEEVTDNNNDKLVTVFDSKLNPIKSETIPYMAKNKYAAALAEANKERDNACEELNKAYPDYVIQHTDDTMAAVLERRDFVVLCYDRKGAKDYLVRFVGGRTAVLLKEISEDLMPNNIMPYGDYIYCFYSIDNCIYKQRLEKLSSAGETLDKYDFKGVDAVFTKHNGKPAIVYIDLKQFSHWQKKVARKCRIYVGPSALLVIED